MAVTIGNSESKFPELWTAIAQMLFEISEVENALAATAIALTAADKRDTLFVVEVDRRPKSSMSADLTTMKMSIEPPVFACLFTPKNRSLRVAGIS